MLYRNPTRRALIGYEMWCALIVINYAVESRPRLPWEITHKLLFPTDWRVPGLNRPHLSILLNPQLLIYLHLVTTDA